MKRAWEITHLAFVALLIAICYLAVTCVAIAIFHANVDPKDFWTAVGVPVNALVALGTFGAAGIALWVSKDQRRQQQADELVRARLSAVGAVPKLQSAVWKAGTAAVAIDGALTVLEYEGVQTYETLTEHAQSAKRGFESLKGIPYLEFDEIRSMVALPDHCAMQIEGAHGRLRAAMADLHEVQNRFERLVSEMDEASTNDNIAKETKAEFAEITVSVEAEYQRNLFGNAHERLTEAEKLLNNAIGICEKHTSTVDNAILTKRS
ncbi:hypothetical protein [Burkholderia vietnamiensis]|uniref:hypothetical protein n=1 Tax=Burkholderia vietnamiensis TaxID=60552 RepID=UPI0012DB71C5|nr:hypothetical protein [Burkholderia vietnamiensis]